MNFLEGEMTNDGYAVRLKAGTVLNLAARCASDGPAVTVGIRPEYVAPGTGDIELGVELIEPLGSETVIHGRIAASGEALVARIAGTAPAGDTLRLTLPSRHLHLFDQASGVRLEPVSRQERGGRADAG